MTSGAINSGSSIVSGDVPGLGLSNMRATIAFGLIACLSLVTAERVAAQGFNDVPTDHWAFSFIEIFAANGISAGCGAADYCPEDMVTRAQMAVFLERGMRGSSYTPPPATGNVFLDVGVNDFAANFIEQLFLDGISGGCGGNNYCPNDAVTRAQMAVFLLRARHGAGYSPPTPSGTSFDDVDAGYWALAWIEQLVAEGITVGCGGGNFCPESTVTRAQMAVFLVRTFNLQGPPVAVVTTIIVVLADSEIQAATTTTAAATILDQNGVTMTGKAITWSSASENIATVDSTGTVLGVVEGQSEIIATVDSTTGRASLSVTPASVATVTIGTANSTMFAGDSAQLSVIVADAAGTELSGRTVTWASSDTTVVGVSASGLASAALPGQVMITASSEGIDGTLTISVTAPTLAQETAGLTGHIGASVNTAAVPAGHGYGFSFYSSVYTLNPEPAQGTQLGWGTWIIPDNRDFTQALCPIGTFARDNWPERGPTWRDVYQTIEGGMGQWGSTRFPSPRPKFRVNAVPDCYSTQVASTGWDFGINPLMDEKLVLAQLSNRLLMAPDGITFTGANTASLLGYGWIALPLIQAYVSPLGMATGDQSWTLFLNTANFEGPVAFLTPEAWSAVAALDPTGAGRGLDAQPALVGSPALELGNVPMVTSQDLKYRRIPRLTFPATTQKATLVQDIHFHSKLSVWNAVEDWIQNGTVASQFDPSGAFPVSLTVQTPGISMAGDPVVVDPVVVTSVFQTSGGGEAFGLQWTGIAESGTFPEYFENVNGTWTAVDPASVPRDTWLSDHVFTPASRGTAGDITAIPAWSSAGWSAGPFAATLTDGSQVDYVWYRFVDQPAIARLGLGSQELQDLQTLIESLHEQFGVSGVTIAPPSSGALATIDPALLVVPPAGLEKGYVPVVIRQY